MINFKMIKWKNFLSTGNTFTEIDLNKHKTTLIVGENGAGKSTILDALSFVLFNKPFRGVNKPQLINTINKKDMLVEVNFDIGLQRYRIVRGVKPTVFEIYLDDVMMNQDSTSRDYQEVLERQILKLNHKSFCQVVMLGSASFVPFMQLSSANRREIIEDLLDIQIFSTMNSLLKSKTQTLSTQLNSVNNSVEIINEKINSNKQLMKTLNENNKAAIEDKVGLISATNIRIDEEKANVNNITVMIRELQEQIADEKNAKSKQQKLHILKSQIQTKINKLQEDINFFEQHDDCPTCRQEIDNQFKCDTIDSRKQQILTTKNGITKLEEELITINNRLNEISQINNQIIDYNMQVTVHNTNITALNEYVGKLNTEIGKLSETHKNNDKDINRLEALNLELSRSLSIKEEYTNDMEVYKTASIILKDSGIKAKIIKQYVPVINKLINKYLASMDFFVNFELDENFNETIKSRFRDDFSYASFSEGEKMRINLAILFTWRAIAKLRNSASTNLLIMDEIFDGSLDNNGTEEFLKIINQLTLDTNTFIISHKTDQLVDKFEKTLKFEKHKNFSRIAA